MIKLSPAPGTPSGKPPFSGKLKSIRSLFLLAMSFLILMLSLSLLLSGTELMGQITHQLGTELLSEKLTAKLATVEQRYKRLEQIGLEDSAHHLNEIRLLALADFSEFSYKLTGKFFVVHQARQIILSADFNRTDDPDFDIFFNRLSPTGTPSAIAFNAAGSQKLAVYTYYPRWESYVGIAIAESELFAARNKFIRINAMVLATVVLLAILIMFGMQHLLVTPLLRLADYTSDVIRGKYRAEIRGKFVLELLTLKTSVIAMVTALLQKMDETRGQLDTIKRRERELDEALRSLRTSEERLQAILDNTTAVIFLKDRQGRYLTINSRFEKLFAVTRDGIQGKNDGEIFSAQTAQTLQEHDRLVLEKNEPIEFEEQLEQSDGMHTYISIKFPLHDDQGAPYAVCSVSTDITIRKRAEDKLAAEQEQLAVTLRSIGDGVITTDIQGKIVLLNKVAERLTGWTQLEAAGKPLEEVFSIINQKNGKRSQAPIRVAMESGRVLGLEKHTALIARDGTVRSIADSAAPIINQQSEIIGAVLVFRDVTEKNKMEEELFKAKKLESVGVLAGGIAHDFNNILVAILGNLSLARELIDPEHKVQALLEKSEKASIKAKGLTHQLLTFAKGGEPVKETASIAEVIRESAEFILHGGNVVCSTEMPEDLWSAEIDPGQISQVIQNIVINACHAMPDGGTVKIHCENVRLAGSNIYNLADGNYVKISISDEGHGIPEEYLYKIFDPYFSLAKGGSGLGLAITHSIVSKHGGHIEASSKPGQGATFTVYLPATGKPAPLAKPDEPAVSRLITGRILIMDDEEMVREVTRQILGHYGYEVETAADGDEALALYQKARAENRPFDAVIMDLTIPAGMGGREALEKLLELDPHAAAVVSSGYSTDPVMSNYEKFGFKAAVCKPYEAKNLLITLEKVISRKK